MELSGYRVRRLLGTGSLGAVWLARDLASGRPVVIKRVPASSVPRPESFRRDLALARGLGHRHVVRLGEVRQAEREWLVVSEYVAAGALTALLERRGPLRTGELVTLLSPIADALGAAHQAGIVHGHLGAGDILLTADGRPLLADLGLHSSGSDASAHDLSVLGDIARDSGGDPALFTPALFTGDGGTVATRLLGLADPEPVDLDPTISTPPPTTSSDAAPGTSSGDTATATSSGATSGDSATAAGSGSSAGSPAGIGGTAGEPRPVVGGAGVGAAGVGAAAGGGAAGGATRSNDFFLPVPARPSQRASGRGGGSARGRQVRVLVVLAAAVIALGLVGGLGINELRGRTATASDAADQGIGETGSSITPAPSPGTTATPGTSATPDRSATPGGPGGGRSVGAWRATLVALDGLRAEAFARLAPTVLDTVYLPGSAPWRSDRALLAAYRQRDVRVDGLRIEIQRVDVDRGGQGSVVLRVLDRFAGGTAVDRDGRRTPLPPGQPTTRLITLTGAGADWRIASIIPA